MSTRRPCRTRRIALAVAVCATSAALVFSVDTAAPASRSRGADATPFKIALLTELSGRFAPTRKPFNDGLVTYFKTIGGKIAGHKFSLSVYDGQSDPTVAPGIARQALSSKPNMLAVFLLSTSTAAAEPILESANLPTMGPGIPDDWVAGPKIRPWAFGLGSALENAQAFDAGLKYLFKGNVKGKRVAITGDNSAFDTLILDDLKALAPKSGWTVALEKFGDFTELSWASQAAEVAAAKPDAVIDITVGAPTILHGKAYGTAGIKVPILSFVGLNVASDVKGIALPNWYMVTAGRYGGYKPGSLIDKAAAKYGTKESSQGGLYASGWATGAIVARALNLCGVGCTSSKLLEVLGKFKNYDVPGGAMYGPITFTSKDHSGVTAFGLVKYDPKTDGLVDVTTLKLP